MSSWTTGAGRTTTWPVPRAERERRMRGRLGTGTEGVVQVRVRAMFAILRREPSRGAFTDRDAESRSGGDRSGVRRARAGSVPSTTSASAPPSAQSAAAPTQTAFGE